MTLVFLKIFFFPVFPVLKLEKYQEDEGGVANQSYGSGELAFVSSTVRPGRLVCVLGQLQLFQGPPHHLQEGEQEVTDGDRDGRNTPPPSLLKVSKKKKKGV